LAVKPVTNICCFADSRHFAPRFFCEITRARFAHSATLDDKRQFLEQVERIIYDRCRVTVVGSVLIKMQLSNSREIETRKLAFCLRGEIDKSTLHKTKARKKFAEDGRMDDGRKPRTISATASTYALPSLTPDHSTTI
jgi:hypothetical protein